MHVLLAGAQAAGMPPAWLASEPPAAANKSGAASGWVHHGDSGSFEHAQPGQLGGPGRQVPGGAEVLEEEVQELLPGDTVRGGGWRRRRT